MWLTDIPDNRVEEVILYGAIVLLGAGVATLQVNSLAMIADLIGPITVCLVIGRAKYLMSEAKLINPWF